MTQATLRPELDELPRRMKSLPIDDRGYPVPWFVAWVDGKPEFRAMDLEKWSRAIGKRLCWVCGDPLGIYLTFVSGPMCGINRTTAEPPTHKDCALWSARNCPFLSNPDASRRAGIDFDPRNAPGIMLTRNPGVTMLWTTHDYTTFSDGKGKWLITMGEPVSVEWYAYGRAATREEVLASIDSGMPALVAAARTEEGAIKFLDQARQAFEKYIPR